MAGRLGSTDLVNTIVIAHPNNLPPAQVRAIKVRNSAIPLIVVRLMVSLTFSRFLPVGCWPKVTHNYSFF